MSSPEEWHVCRACHRGPAVFVSQDDLNKHILRKHCGGLKSEHQIVFRCACRWYNHTVFGSESQLALGKRCNHCLWWLQRMRWYCTLCNDVKNLSTNFQLDEHYLRVHYMELKGIDLWTQSDATVMRNHN